jgi:hypothetical protein
MRNILATQQRNKMLGRKAFREKLQVEFMAAFSALKQAVEPRRKKIVPRTEFQITDHKGEERFVGQ